MSNQTQDKIVEYMNFSKQNLVSSEPEAETIKKPDGSIIASYHDIKIHYNYGTPERPIIDECYIDFPVVKATGIRVKEEEKDGKNGKYTKKVNSMMFIFDLSDEKNLAETESCLAKLGELHSGACHTVSRYKGKLKKFDFNPESPGESFKSPVYYHRNTETGEIIKGKNPSMWVTLKDYRTNRTLFTDLNGNKIEWDLLQDVELDLVPLVHVEKIFVGTKMSLKCFLHSAIVLRIVPINSESKQKSTMERLKQKYGDNIQSSVENQLANLRLGRQEALLQKGVNASMASGGLNSSMSTPLGGDGGGNMYSMGGDNQQSVNDFLSGESSQPQHSQPQQQPVTMPQMTPQTQPVTMPQMSSQPQMQSQGFMAPRLNVQPTTVKFS